MKKIFRIINPLRYINGAKGAISLFLAVLLTPFLSIAMILVESGRYNSAVSEYDEAAGVSSVSTLAHYDEYLQKRWGLLGVSQDIDINTKFSEYLNTNAGIMGDSIAVNSINAKGEYPLSDREVLCDQILEFCKLNAPTELATDFLDLSSLLKCFENIKNFDNIISLFTNASDAIDNTITFVESTEEIKAAADNLDSLKSDYNEKYDAFEKSVNDLIEALKEDRPDDEEEALNYDENINNLRQSVTNTQKEYAFTIQDIVDNMNTYKEKMSDSSSALSNIQSDITSAVSTSITLEQQIGSKKQALDKKNADIKRMEDEGFNESNTAYTDAINARAELENEMAELQTEKGLADASKKGLSNVSNGWNNSSNQYNDAVFGVIIDGFSSLKNKVNTLSANSITKDTGKITPLEYKSSEINGYVKSENVDEFINQQEKELQEGSLSALIDGITSFFDSIFKFSAFYDSKLSANIDTDYYERIFGGLPGSDSAEGGVIAVVKDIGKLVKDAGEFVEDIITLKLISALKKIAELIQTTINLLRDIGQFALDVCNNIVNLFSGYDRLYYSTYTAYNLPCRTDDNGSGVSFKTMAGYSLNTNSLPSQGEHGGNATLFDDFSALVNAISAFVEGTGDDITFSGAELEYVLYGSNSEISNQLYTSCVIYLFRLLLDIFPVLSDPEIQSLAAASTFGYPIVMVLMIFAEPLADTILLVNGGEVPFWETDIYLSPSGFPGLLEKLISICKFTTEQKESLKSDLVNSFGAADENYDYQRTLRSWNEKQTSSDSNKDSELKKGVSKYLNGLISFDYREYCFMILLLTVTKEQQIARISNLIQMETLYYYNQNSATYTFDLRKSYTYIDSNVNVSIKQMLPSLTDSSLFTFDRRCFRGY